ncbi:MAG: InlB B-repeat-containing protein [Oscillospiraceae bacterium]|nr:InlB B-repeat-containing protein [Oscillospiraceae bacterium]
MKSKSKKLFSVLLAAVMVFGMLASMTMTSSALDPIIINPGDLVDFRRPNITSHPVDRDIVKGQNTTFSVVATSTFTLTYEWQYKDGTVWKIVPEYGELTIGRDTPTLTMNNVTMEYNGMVFRCKVSNTYGTVYSNEAKLTVRDTMPKIDVHPADKSILSGQSATFSVQASGIGPLTYQWQYQLLLPGFDWQDIAATSIHSNVKTPTLNVNNFPFDNHAPENNSIRYRCKVTNAHGTVYSNQASLTVTAAGPPPTITGPATMTLAAGYAATSTDVYTLTGTSTVTVTKTSGNASVTWNNTTNTLDIAAGLAAGTYPVMLVASNYEGDTYFSFTLTVTAASAPAITGSTTMTLTAGYAATSTDAYTINGNPAPTITKTSGDGKITWNNSTNKLDVAAGLTAGTYPVVLKASNGVTPDATLTFTLTVTAADTPPSIVGPTTMTLTAGYAAVSTEVYTITGNPAPTVTKTSGDIKITWNNSTNKLDVAAGLAAGAYPVVLTVSNSAGSTTFTFTLTVTATSVPTFTVTFNSNGGSAVSSQSVASGGKAAKPSDPTRAGYTFAGWYADSGLTAAYNFDTAVTANLTLYAKWTADSTPPPTTTGSMSNFVKKKTYTFGMFTDVNENEWYGYNNVNRVIANAYEYGLMQGDSATTFKPTGNITIAEAITVAARVHSIYMTGAESFTASEPWYKVYVDYAITNGIIVSNDFTDYTRPATRAEMAYIFSRSLPAAEFASPNTVNSLPDVNNGTPYRDAIFMLYRAGILAGNDDLGTFNPGNNITRAEAAAIISRVILPGTRMSGKIFG